MKTCFYFLAFLILCLNRYVQAQDGVVYVTQSLVDINLRFELPAEVWSKADVTKTKSGSKIYTYTRKLTKEHKKSAKATLSVLVEKVKPSTSMKDYSLKSMSFFQQQSGFKINKAFTSSDGRFNLPYTVGYEAEYLDGNQVKHHLYILHTIEFNHAAQWLMDFPADEQERYEEEQTKIIQSLRYERF